MTEFIPALGYEDTYEVQQLSNDVVRVRTRHKKRIVKRAAPGHVLLRDSEGVLKIVDVASLLPVQHHHHLPSRIGWLMGTISSIGWVCLSSIMTTVVMLSSITLVLGIFTMYTSLQLKYK